MRMNVVGVGVVMAMTGCSATEEVGAVDLCFNVTGEGTGVQDVDNFTGEGFDLRLVGEGEAVAAPDGRDCSEYPAHAELVDRDGRHLWLGASADAGAGELLAADAFAGLERGSLQVSSSTGYAFTQSLQLDNDDGTPVLAIRQSVGVDEGAGTGSLIVAEGGATALPSFVTCGLETTKSLDFTGDDGGVVSLHNGNHGLIVVEGVNVVATNIWAADYSTDCDDGPSGFEATWVATRAP